MLNKQIAILAAAILQSRYADPMPFVLEKAAEILKWLNTIEEELLNEEQSSKEHKQASTR